MYQILSHFFSQVILYISDGAVIFFPLTAELVYHLTNCLTSFSSFHSLKKSTTAKFH